MWTSVDVFLVMTILCVKSQIWMQGFQIVSPTLRTDIIQGRDVNLASHLIQGFASKGELGQRTAVARDCCSLKPLQDHRLTRQLTITEFMKAFTIYRNIMCEVYPHCRSELDAYLRLIVDKATDFGRSNFTSKIGCLVHAQHPTWLTIVSKLTGLVGTTCIARCLLGEGLILVISAESWATWRVSVPIRPQRIRNFSKE